MARPPLKNIDPLQIFLHASGFHMAEDYLASVDINKDPQSALEMAPATMVLSALNSELFFKCLICIETGVVPPGHYLDLLFDQLAPATKKRIEHIWDNEVTPLRKSMWDKIEDSIGKGARIKRDLKSALKAGSRAFEEIRYSYEPNSQRSQFYINDLPRLLGFVILEKKPEWTRIRRKVTEVPEELDPYIPPPPGPAR